MNEPESDKPVVAAFDFDGTLTRRETLLPFLLYTLGAAAVARHAFILAPTLVGYGLGLIRNDVAKERVLMRCLDGMSIGALQDMGEHFVLGETISAAMKRARKYEDKGYRC